MSRPQIPARVLLFIDERIDSVPQLETLLMMFDDPQHSWSVTDVAARVYVSLEDAKRVLEALRRRALISPEPSGTAYRISVDDGAERAMVDEVARTYRANLTYIATYIHEKPSAPVMEFARAFNLKKDN